MSYFKKLNTQHLHNMCSAMNQRTLAPTVLRDCRQITFITLNGFCPLSKTPPTPPALHGQYQNGQNTNCKIKCKIHAHFILTKFYKIQLARQLVLIQTMQSVTKFYLQIADKKLTTTVFPLLFCEAYSLGHFAKLSWRPEPRAHVEKIENPCYPISFVAVEWTVYLKLLFQSHKYQ